jgi:membrane protease YdiL (CAAX protease family)
MPLGAGLLELASVFAVGPLVIGALAPLVGPDPLARGAVVWVANLAMLSALWLQLRRRGQSWADLGFSFDRSGPRGAARLILQAVAVFVAALVAFVAGAVAAGLVFGRPEQADVSGYGYLRGNPLLLIGILLAVYLASSFGEEALYRGFLITRIAELGGSRQGAWRLGVLLSAVVFGLVHYEWGIAGAIQTGFMGLALGASYLVVGRRLPVLVLAHAGLDTLLLVQVYLSRP